MHDIHDDNVSFVFSIVIMHVPNSSFSQCASFLRRRNWGLGKQTYCKNCRVEYVERKAMEELVAISVYPLLQCQSPSV